MFWYRMECGLGRFSVVGTTVRTATLPEHLLADEHHQVLDGQKVYIATTVGNGCCLGAEPAEAAGSDELKVAYQVFKDEACDVSPKYAPKTVSTDGWKGTQAAWKVLFTKVVILLCLARFKSKPFAVSFFRGGQRRQVPLGVSMTMMGYFRRCHGRSSFAHGGSLVLDLLVELTARSGSGGSHSVS